MINIPYNKWTLNFTSAKYEAEYQQYVSEIKVICFKVLTLLITVAAVVGLIIFLVQQQSNTLLIVMGVIIFGCFTFFLLSDKLKSYMTGIFSFMYVWSFFSCVIISFSGLQIPLFAFGFSTGVLQVGELQFSDNRLKLFFVITTPIVLLWLFDVYQINTLTFLFHLLATISFITPQVYKNEYISRQAFSLNIIVNKQKEIINEFVLDAMLAVSLNQRTMQFELEFLNKTFENYFDITNVEQMRTFLRASFCIEKQKFVRKLTDSLTKKKQLTLEEYLFSKVTSDEIIQNENQEVYYFHRSSRKIQSMHMQLKHIDYGKPVLIILFKKDDIPKFNKDSDRKIKYYENIILRQSQQLAEKQLIAYKEARNIINNKSQTQRGQLLQCLHSQLINYIRNYIIYFQKEKIFQQAQDMKLESCRLNKYLETIFQYFIIIARNNKKRFDLTQMTDNNLHLKLNLQFLTQILMNVFEIALKYSTNYEFIVLEVQEEQNFCSQQSELKTIQDSKSEQKIIKFRFRFFSESLLDFQAAESQEYNFTQPNNDDDIQWPVVNILLCLLGPYNRIFSTSNQHNIGSQITKYLNTIKFYVYSDQTVLDKTYVNFIKGQTLLYH